MANDKASLSRTVRVVNELGLHARTAGMIAKLVENATSHVWIQKNGKKVDASSIIDILMLEGTKGSQVEIIIDHPADVEILNAIEALIERGFEE